MRSSYPNFIDEDNAEQMGVSPGSNIVILNGFNCGTAVICSQPPG